MAKGKRSKENESEAKFKIALKLCNKAHGQLNDNLKVENLALVKTLKSELCNRMKSLENAYLDLTEYDLEDQYFDIYSETNEESLILISKVDTLLDKNRINETRETGIRKSCGLNLPHFAIPLFSGNAHDWLNFKEVFFTSIVENVDLTNIEKMQYLQTSCKGQASQLISGFPISASNFVQAWDTLVHRYDNKKELSNIQVGKLFNLKPAKGSSSKSLYELLDACNEAIRNLKSLGFEINPFVDLLLVNIMQSKIDDPLRQQWELSLDNDCNPSFATFVKFIEKYARSMSVVKENQNKLEIHKSIIKKSCVNNVLVNNNSKYICISCKGNHLLFKCDQFKTLSLDERWKFVKTNQLCANCLRANHRSNQCLISTRCKSCGKHHHTLLHAFKPAAIDQSLQKDTINSHYVSVSEEARENDQISLNQDFNSPNGSSQCFSTANTTCNTLLSTAVIKVKGANEKVYLFRALLDSGSQKSLISDRCCRQLGLKSKRAVHTITGINDTVAETSVIEVNTMFSAHFNNNWIEMNALVVKKVTSDLPNFEIPYAFWPHLKHLLLADPHYAVTRPVDILIGADLFADLLTGSPIIGPVGSPSALNSKLGFLLSGKIDASNSASKSIINCHAIVDPTQELQKFWELESLPTACLMSPEDKHCEELYSSTVAKDPSGRYIVHLPLKCDISLGNTRDQALKRFEFLEKKLNKHENLKSYYHKFMKEYIQLNHMELVTEKSINNQNSCFLPHHGVFKEDSTTTKLRVVFDASMKSSSGMSLNQSMFVGPKLQSNLFSTLIKFRSFPIALSADIEKMYRQIRVFPDHTNYQLILWRFSPHEQISTYRLLTVTYGTACAPFLAIRTLQQLATDGRSKFPIAAEVTLSDFYVDDLLTGAHSIDEAKELINQMNDLMRSGGLTLRKWCSNKPQVLEEMDDNLKSIYPCVDIEENQSQKILGIKWNFTQDNFQIKIHPESQVYTKRQLLSVIARIFDPLGFLSPTTVLLKIILQDLWREQLSWDDPLPIPLAQVWTKFKEELHYLNEIHIQRYLQSSLSSAANIQIHGFCDASIRAYAAVLYLRVETHSGKIEVNLIASKTKVAPVKIITLPRLELCASLLLAQLFSVVSKSLPKPSDVYLWSDSNIVLCWLKTDPSKLNTFVSHRVAEVQSLTSNSKWDHVDGKENPADCASRGIMPQQLLNHNLWWTGPQWLSEKFLPSSNPANLELNPSSKSEIELSESERESVESETKPSKSICLSTRVLDIDFLYKFSTLSKLIRVVAWCLRFLHNSQCNTLEKRKSHLTASELEGATLCIVKLIQQSSFHAEIQSLKKKGSLPSNCKLLSLNPFLDKGGMLRVGGRLKHSSLSPDKKHPLLIPKNNPFTELVINYYHTYSLHAGTQVVLSLIRQRFWFTSGRDKVRRALLNCITCFKTKTTTAQQMMGNLPRDRVVVARPFQKTGLDFAGPVITKPNLKRSKITLKSYIALFICFATKAVHLEVVSELTSEAFLASLRRFISRRGKPSDISCDNATNFKGAKNYLQTLKSDSVQNFVAQQAINWHFIPPAAPHFGGLWESNIKSMKQHLKKICKTAILNFEELSTLVTQIEACLNSRPLTPLSPDPTDLQALTPGHFLIGSSLLALPEPTSNSDNLSLSSRWKIIQALRAQFWKRWSLEYLTQLQQRPKWTKSSPNLQLGQLVLLKDDNKCPMHWSLGRITAVYPGDDNLVRVADVRTQTGTFRRAHSKLCPLPNQNLVGRLSNGGENVQY